MGCSTKRPLVSYSRRNWSPDFSMVTTSAVGDGGQGGRGGGGGGDVQHQTAETKVWTPCRCPNDHRHHHWTPTHNNKDGTKRTHEAGGEPLVSAGLPVHLHQLLHADHGDLTLGQGVFQPVAEDDDQGQGLATLQHKHTRKCKMNNQGSRQRMSAARGKGGREGPEGAPAPTPNKMGAQKHGSPAVPVTPQPPSPTDHPTHQPPLPLSKAPLS
jgi:hypothetical protein